MIVLLPMKMLSPIGSNFLWFWNLAATREHGSIICLFLLPSTVALGCRMTAFTQVYGFLKTVSCASKATTQVLCRQHMCPHHRNRIASLRHTGLIWMYLAERSDMGIFFMVRIVISEWSGMF